MSISDWFERRRLVRKGRACDKTRLRTPSDTLQGRLESSSLARWMIPCVFLLLLYLGVIWGHPPLRREHVTLAFIVFVSGLMLLELDCPEIWRSNSKLILVLGASWFNLAFIKGLFIDFPPQAESDMTRMFFLCPFTFAPFLVTLLLGTRAGLFCVLQVSILASILIPTFNFNDPVPMIDRNFTFLLVSLLSGFTAVYFTRDVRNRAHLIRAGLAVGTLNLLCAVAIGLVAGRDWMELGREALYAIGIPFFTALAVSAVLPLVERAFQITTTISWLELADLNHPLLQQMTMEAPGTYHHSLLVANLAEAGAKAIGLDPTACRVMAYFHDVGKIVKPEYFTENIPPGANPHENLSPSMSSLIIIAHVKEGVDLALKYGLKRRVIEAIQQHHGDSVVSYFHQRALQQQEDARAGGKIMNMREEDVPEVSEDSFRYPGPRPQSKEVALLSLADAVEASSRSLEKPTPQRIEDMVNEIVEHKVADHQFDESHLTLNELRAAAEAMATTVKNMMHTRIAYAKKDKTSASKHIQPAGRGTGQGPASSVAA
jgi:putative nucleotidyltransferase with HDIG domain